MKSLQDVIQEQDTGFHLWTEYQGRPACSHTLSLHPCLSQRSSDSSRSLVTKPKSSRLSLLNQAIKQYAIGTHWELEVSTLDESEGPVSRPGRWVGPRTDLQSTEKSLVPAGNRTSVFQIVAILTELSKFKRAADMVHIRPRNALEFLVASHSSVSHVTIALEISLGCLHPVACVRSGDGRFLSVYATSLS
jgi:hypothetical protein